MRVAIQGQAGSYHHQAATQLFGNSLVLVSCETFKDTFEAIEKDKADVGVVAIENSLFGSINQTYDLLLKKKFWVTGELYLRIEHCLIGLPDATIEDLKEIHSQAEALAQCEEYLDTKLSHVARLEHHDTAASVQDVKRWGDKHKAAIASEHAANLYGLRVLERGIEDNKENYTRFVVIQKNATRPKDATKTSLVLTTGTDTKAGALHKALGAFAERNINLTLLHSRPIVGKAWHYLFYVDLESGAQTSEFQSSLSDLEALGFDVHILGSYKGAKDGLDGKA